MSALSFYEQMLFIRGIEESFLEKYALGLFKGTVHTSIGQESCAVGVLSQIDKQTDIVFSNHRCHGHFIAYSWPKTPALGLVQEVMGMSGGICLGNGGSQHIHYNNFYSNGVQGGIVPLTLGTALAERYMQRKAVSIVYIGDGTMGEGVVYECFNIASKWNLPILFVLENNLYAQTTPVEIAHAGSFCSRANAFDIETKQIDASDVLLLAENTSRIIQQVRNTSRPYFLELKTYRYSPHSKGDDFRDSQEILAFKQKDPIQILEGQLKKSEYQLIQEKVQKEVSEVFAKALQKV